MECTQNNPYARDLLQTKIVLARHYIDRRGFADDFKELRANVLAYLKNYFYHNNRKAGYEIRLSDIKLIATSLNG